MSEEREWLADLPDPTFEVGSFGVQVDCLPERILITPELLRGAHPDLLQRWFRTVHITARNMEATYRLVRYWPSMFGAELVDKGLGWRGTPCPHENQNVVVFQGAGYERRDCQDCGMRLS
jgi:hypothetical protein